MEEAKRKAKSQKHKKMTMPQNYSLMQPFGGNSTQTLLLSKNQQTQSSVLQKPQLLTSITSEQDADYVLEKCNCSEKFDVPPFIGMKKKLMFIRRGELRKDSSDKHLTKETLLQGDKDYDNAEIQE